MLGNLAEGCKVSDQPESSQPLIKPEKLGRQEGSNQPTREDNSAHRQLNNPVISRAGYGRAFSA